MNGNKVPGSLKEAFAKEVKSRVSAFNKEHPDYQYSRAGRKETAKLKAKSKDKPKSKDKAPAKAKPKTKKKK
jgi:hypothetical protein